jgi:hypothetical protein
VIIRRLSFSDTGNTFHHTYDPFSDDDQRQELQALDQMRILEADDAPNNCNEKNEKTFSDGDDNPGYPS